MAETGGIASFPLQSDESLRLKMPHWSSALRRSDNLRWQPEGGGGGWVRWLSIPVPPPHPITSVPNKQVLSTCPVFQRQGCVCVCRIPTAQRGRGRTWT